MKRAGPARSEPGPVTADGAGGHAGPPLQRRGRDESRLYLALSRRHARTSKMRPRILAASWQMRWSNW